MELGDLRGWHEEPSVEARERWPFALSPDESAREELLQGAK
jgi:hypothetical protein